MAAFPVTLQPNFVWGNETGPWRGMESFKEATILGTAVNFSRIALDPTGSQPLPGGPTRAIWADVAGTITGHDAYGNPVTAFPLIAGWNAISLAGVTSLATTTQVWAIY